MQFLYQPLTWAFFLVLAPLLIHLINLMRQRRVQWAAMDFLLKSYKKHRRWVWLRQLLLLLLRMLAIASIVAMLAHLVTDDEWSNLFSGQATHHYIVLDDSFSMMDRLGSVESFDLARQAMSQICRQASKQGTVQKLTLIRYSQAGKTSATETEAASIMDVNGEQITDALLQKLDEQSKSLAATDLAIGPQAALELLEKLIRQASGENPVVHLLSDFREETWSQPAGILPALELLGSSGVDIRFVRCAKEEQPNIGIVGLVPSTGTHAAGVPMLVDVTVKNFSSEPVDDVQVEVQTTFHPTSVDGSESQAITEQLPNIVIETLQPDQTVTRQVEVYFATPGYHVVRASLEPDALETDNDRWCVVNLPDGIPTLLVDDTIDQRSVFFLESVFRPGKRSETGIRTTVQPETFLRDSSSEELSNYRAIFVLRPETLSGRAIENLDAYVRNGGGLTIFLGPEADIGFLNDWHADGTGLFPVELDTVADLPPDPNAGPDVLFSQHPIFAVLQGERNPFARKLRINRYIKAKSTWRANDETATRVIATLRNGQPLAVEKRFGDGRVIVFLTTADTTWNNWAKEPSFVVAMLQLHGYLATNEKEAVSHRVGEPIVFQLDAAKYGNEVVIRTPGRDNAPGATIKQTAPVQSDSPVLTFTIGQGKGQSGRTGETDTRGVYEVEAVTVEGNRSFLRFALNVDNRDSDLAIADNVELANRLAEVDYSVFNADEIVYGTVNNNETSWSDVLFAFLIPLLLLEQVVAYLTSYHPKPIPSAGGRA